MEFFDDKEDVFDIQMTQFGKYLLSKGKFKPKFYSFSDDNVLYDISHMSASVASKRPSEASFNTHDRIKKETPRLKAQYLFSGVETEFNRTSETKLYDSLDAPENAIPSSVDQRKAFKFSIGDSDPSAEKTPAYSIYFAKAPMSSSAIADSVLEIKNIPQLHVVHDLETKIGHIEDTDQHFFFDEEEYVFLDVKEINQLFQKENFDIEVYEYTTEQNSQGQEVERLRQLSFLPNEEGSLKYATGDQIANAFPELTRDYVEYYFNINVDEEIDDEILCDVHFQNKSEDIFADSTLEFECVEGLDQSFGSALPGGPNYNITPPEDPC